MKFMISKKILLPIVAIVLTGGAVLGTSNIVSANTNGQNSLVQMIAQKFNIDQTQVQAVFDAWHQQHQATMLQNSTQRENNRLDQLVSQGKITSSQKQAILDELAKLRNEFSAQSLKTMTPDQRKQAMQNMQNEISQWSQSTGINAMYLRQGFGPNMGLHRGWGKHFGPVSPSATPTATP